MSDQSDVIVKLDDRVRLISAALSITTYPEKTQQFKPHGTHSHARAMRKYLADHSQHRAVQSTQNLLDQGTPLEALFALVTLMNWPDMSIAALPAWAPADYNIQLREFYEAAELADWWQKENSAWDKSISEVKNVFTGVKYKPFYEQFFGEISEQFVFIPNISYPADHEVGFRLTNELICIAPPPLAWGDSPPWPYDEPTMVVNTYRAAMTVYGRLLLTAYLRANMEQLAEITKNELPITDQFRAQHPTWEDQFTTLFLSAAVAMYLEDYVDEREYKSYMLMEKKAQGMTNLPGTVSVLRRYLQEVGNDKYNNLIEFLPIFPKQLRVAQKIVTF